MKLVSITPSDNPVKKYKAVFQINDTTKTIHFGSAGYSDYLQHRDESRKTAYLLRHQVRENFNNPLTAGSLSRWILWNKMTLRESIADFKRKFNL